MRSLRRFRAAPLVIVLLMLAAGTGCAQIRDQVQGDDAAGATDPVADTETLVVSDWGVLDGIVSVLVRNPTDRLLRHADAVITVRDAEGRALGTSSSQTYQGRCCTAVNVPPHGQVGFYFIVGDEAPDVREVDVDYRDVSWAPNDGGGGPTATAEAGTLRRNAHGTLATATVSVTGGPIENAIVQAVVDGPAGRLLSVISGQWYCFKPDEVRPIAMQLFEPVPPGSTIREVNVFPIAPAPLGGDANLAGACGAAVGRDRGAPAGRDAGGVTGGRQPSGPDRSGSGR